MPAYCIIPSLLLRTMNDLAHSLELTATVHKSSGTMEMYYLKIPALLAKSLTESKKARLVCTLAGSIRFQCALMPHGNGDFYIMLNKKNRSALGLKEGSQVDTLLELDQSRYGLDMPEELAEVLAQEPEGDRIFHSLTAGRQRSFIFWVSQAKSPDKRIERALTLVEKLVQYGPKLKGDQWTLKE